jgi:hypothetical protein
MDAMQAYRFHSEIAKLGVQQAGTWRTSLLCALRKMLLKQVERILERKISLEEWQRL